MSDGYFFNFEKLPYIRAKKPNYCILCDLFKSNPQVPDLTVYKDKFFAASLNLYPYNPGHLLLFPIRHILDIREYTKEEELLMSKLVPYFLDILDKTHKPSGYNLGYNMGLPAGASIAHLHMHIIPRYPSEIGIADLIAGKRVLVEHPNQTREKIRKIINQYPLSMSST